MGLSHPIFSKIHFPFVGLCPNLSFNFRPKNACDKFLRGSCPSPPIPQASTPVDTAPSSRNQATAQQSDRQRSLQDKARLSDERHERGRCAAYLTISDSHGAVSLAWMPHGSPRRQQVDSPGFSHGPHPPVCRASITAPSLQHLHHTAMRPVLAAVPPRPYSAAHHVSFPILLIFKRRVPEIRAEIEMGIQVLSICRISMQYSTIKCESNLSHFFSKINKTWNWIFIEWEISNCLHSQSPV